MTDNKQQEKQQTQYWYVLIRDQKFGPYGYKDIIRMLQTNQLMDYSYVWAPHLDSWTPIYQLEEFGRDRFQVLLQKESDYLNAFVQRVNKRIDVDIDILGHNHIRFFDGKLVSVSEAGGLCMLNSPLIHVGDRMKIHLKSSQPNEQSFNAECEVIRKNFSKQRLNAKSGLYYAVRFNDIQPVGLEQIRHWIQSKAA